MTKLLLEDLSGLNRIGIRGTDTSLWLSLNDYVAKGPPNTASRQRDGSLVGRLSATELLWLAEAGCDAQPSCPEADNDYRSYKVSRRDSHCWFVLTGAQSAVLLSKICGFDVRPESFEDLQVAQTSMSRIGAIVIRDDADALLRFHILADSSYADYFWSTLIDAGTEFMLETKGR